MSILEIDVQRVRTTAVQLGAASTGTHEGAATLTQLRLSLEEAGAPDGAVVADAVQRFSQRASRRLEEVAASLRTHSVDVRDACAHYAEVDHGLAGQLRSIR